MCRAFLIVLLALVQADLFAADVDVVVYADDNYPPYSYKEAGKVEGIYTKILEKAFSGMDGYRVRIQAVPWKRGLRYLERGEGFALYPPYYRIEDRPFIWPYSIPILDEKVVVFCTEEVLAQPRPKWPEDYYGLTVALNAGFNLGGSKFWEAVEEGRIKVQEAGGNSVNLMKLAKRRVDCYVNDRLSILWELKRLRESGEYDGGGVHARLVEAATVSTEQGFLGFTDRDNGKFPYKDNFVKRFNTAIYEMKKRGELQEIVDGFLR